MDDLKDTLIHRKGEGTPKTPFALHVLKQVDSGCNLGILRGQTLSIRTVPRYFTRTHILELLILLSRENEPCIFDFLKGPTRNGI